MKSIVTDNFFDDPSSVIKFAEEQTYYPRNSEQHYEGLRTPDLKDIDLDFYNCVLSKLVYTYYDSRLEYKVDGHMNFHKLSEKDLQDPNWVNGKVHTDDCILSNIIYLTPNAPMTSGTQLCQEIDGEFFPDIVYHNIFNRLIQFPGEVPHSAMDFKGGTEDRLTLLFFLKHIEEVKS